VRTDRDAAFVEELADYVDETIESISEQVPNAPTDRVMLMAVMTIAEELFEARRKNEALRDELAERAEAMDDILEAWTD
jgi:cell division protein ZapA (FtsZ GTPase activity inhibitor)